MSKRNRQTSAQRALTQPHQNLARRRPLLAVERLEDRTLPSTIYGLTPGNVLIRFDSAAPGSITTIGTVSGLGANQTLRGIDFRPRTGQLYGSAVTTASAANSQIFTYTINPLTAQATFVGVTNAALAGAADVPGGYDFNPTVDRIRYVNTNDENARLNPNNGTLAGNDTDLTPAVTSTIIAEAYDRNFDRQTIAAPANNAIPTTLYGIDRNDSQLAIQGGINGTPSPNGGVLTDLAPLGFNLNQANDGGFDIAPGLGLGRGFAALTDAADNLTRLYRINLVTAVSGTPVATSLGLIGNGQTEVRSIAITLPTNVEVLGNGAGGKPRVTVINPQTGVAVASFLAFPATFTGGVRVASGDVNGDSISDVIVGAGAGPPRVKIIDGSKLNLVQANGQISPAALLGNFLALPTSFTGGVNVAAGDVNGDGLADIIVGAGTGSRVRVIDATKINQVQANGVIAPSALLGNFLAYNPGFTGGVNVAAGDVNGDGIADIVTGMASAGSRVKVIDGTKLAQVLANGRIADTALLGNFLTFAPSFTKGVNVGLGDVTADGRHDVLLGMGSGASVVKLVDANKLNQVDANGRISNSALVAAFLAFDGTHKNGVRVGASEFEPFPDGLDDIIVGSGAGDTSQVRVLRGGTLVQLQNFVAFPGKKGLFVSGN